MYKRILGIAAVAAIVLYAGAKVKKKMEEDELNDYGPEEGMLFI